MEFFIDRGVLGANKEIQKVVLEHKGEPVLPGTAIKWDSAKTMVLPVCPPTLIGVCRLIQIYYVLKVINHNINIPDLYFWTMVIMFLYK